jgi:hypothetical protein
VDDATLKRKLNQMVKLSRDLDEEAKRRWPEGWLFAEADGGLHIMSGDADPDRESMAARQKFIEFSAPGIHRIGVGAW